MSVAAGPGLVAAYGFEEGAGTRTADRSGQGNDGQLVGAAWFRKGRFGRALSFNGGGAHVLVSDARSLDLRSGMTLEAWVKPKRVYKVWQTVVMKERRGSLVYALYADSGRGGPYGAALVRRHEKQLRIPRSIPAKIWTHLAVTYDGSRLRLVVNGSTVSDRRVKGPLGSSWGALAIGGNFLRKEWFGGLIDEVRVYNRALSERELRADMRAPVSAPGATEPPPPAPAPPPAPPPSPPPTGATLPCGSSLDAAYDAASPGQVIELQNCSYGGKTLTGSQPSGPHIVFDLNGTDLGEVAIHATWVELRDGSADYYWDAGNPAPSNVVLRNIKATGFFLDGGSNIQILGGELGPQTSDQLNYIFSSRASPITNVVIDGLYVHDNTCVSSGCHYEAIRIDRNATGITIRNSRFERNAIFHIFITTLTGGQLPTNLTFENNTFDRPNPGAYAIKTQEPLVHTCTNYTIRGNRFANAGAIALACPTKVNVVVEGNTFG